jgi:protein deglycase
VARVLVPLAPGFEEIEAVTIVDLLRRAEVEVVTAGLAARRVTGNHGITIEADTLLDDALQHEPWDWDMVALPGGLPGADHLARDRRVLDTLRAAAERGACTAAICAAPGVLAAAGLLEHRAATSFPGALDGSRISGLTLLDAPVVRDGSIITSRGPGTALDFGLALIEILCGVATRDRVAARLQIPVTRDASATN